MSDRDKVASINGRKPSRRDRLEAELQATKQIAAEYKVIIAALVLKHGKIVLEDKELRVLSGMPDLAFEFDSESKRISVDFEEG